MSKIKQTSKCEAIVSQDILYQDNLKRLWEKSNGKEILNMRETAQLLGIKDTRTVKRLYPFTNGYISLATLARCMTPEAEIEKLKNDR